MDNAKTLRQLADKFSEGWHDGIEIDASDVMALSEAANHVENLERKCEILRSKLNHERACRENAVNLIAGIHSLMYPAPVNTPDGRTMVFRPKDPDPHQVLQELSDRIRALPDQLSAQGAAIDPPPLQR